MEMKAGRRPDTAESVAGIVVNGQWHELSPAPSGALLALLRSGLGLTGTRIRAKPGTATGPAPATRTRTTPETATGRPLQARTRIKPGPGGRGLVVSGGAVTGGPGGARVAYRELLTGLRQLDVLDAEPPLTPPTAWRIAGYRPMAAGPDGSGAPGGLRAAHEGLAGDVAGRLDVVTGGRRYASDQSRPGMRHGAVLRPPVRGARLRAADTAVAEWADGRLTVWTGNNVPFPVRARLAEAFGLSEHDVRVIIPPTGGGFGGKRGDEAIEAARLARVAGCPVSQLQGGTVMALGGALFEQVTLANGHQDTRSLTSYRVPRFSDIPQIDVALVDRPDIPSAGAGETPLIAVAPAIANAIFAAAGRRLRALPLLAGDGPLRMDDDLAYG